MAMHDVSVLCNDTHDAAANDDDTASLTPSNEMHPFDGVPMHVDE
jgi:hypothetical protein